MTIKSNFIPIELYNKFIQSKFNDKPISIFNDYPPTNEELSINPYNILIIQEPNQLFGLHNWVIDNYQYFSCILTWSQEILDKCNNALLLPFGTTFLHSKDKYKELANLDKKLEVSFICGNKQMIEGHHLRHKIYNKQFKIKTPTKWFYTTTEPKSICFENSMFHVAIENSKNQNYFTEKIVDAFLTKTIPIYWGCPNIDEFFNTDGIITFNNVDELTTILNNLTYEFYESKKDVIEENYNKAKQYADFVKRIKEFLEEICKINNI